MSLLTFCKQTSAARIKVNKGLRSKWYLVPQYNNGERLVTRQGYAQTVFLQNDVTPLEEIIDELGRWVEL